MESAASERVLAILLRRVSVKGDFLNIVRDEAKTSGRPIDKLLVERNLVSPAEVALALSEYVKMPPISLLHFTPDEKLVELVTQEAMSRNLAIPVSRVGRMLTVALGDPFNIFAIEDIRSITKLDIVPLVAPERDINELLERFGGKKAELEMALEEAMDNDVEVTKDQEVEVQTTDLEEQAVGAPVIRTLNKVLVEGIRKHASGIHLEPMEKNVQLRYRIDGVLYDHPSPPKSMFNAIASRVKILSHLSIAEHRVPQDGRFRIRALGKECDMRVSILPTVHGEKIVMRILDKTALAPSLSALGLDQKAYENIKYAISQPHGMVLVTGPTGSGKTTTLYSALQELNTSDVNVVTIEDPVEYQLQGINQVQTHAEVGLTFARGLRSILRQSPDIIMVGEIRDDETASIAVQAAVTGHLVFSTLHTNDAAGAIARMLYMGIDGFMLAASLLCAQAQRLYRKLCKACRRPAEIPTEILRLHHIDPKLFENAELYKAVGCPKCGQTGYKGRGAMMEILLCDNEMKELILKEPSTSVLRDCAVKNGMLTLREVGLLRAKEGITSIEEVLLVTSGE
jgi:type IV pilus assembly protein PilB